ncbi:MBG domain-containing protein [Marinifilum sp. D737]|uniref:MBG domain-containing protein n=1 Tax=Marinifilum sp. D737 TaxID=2969628 RepID=UPI0022740216|nr:MBG domain-containing protein [Marinifilum sp. D737]MCY1636693.1 T9SS type A sorting domain-containing protein [Marinifilum sp. D737]
MKIFTQIGLIFTLLLFGSVISNAQELVQTFEEENNVSKSGFGIVAGGFDLNNDGYSDFAIGEPSHNGKTGQVHIYLGGSTNDDTPDLTIKGVGFDNRFGQRVRNGGDINKDGFDDIIIMGDDLESEANLTYIYFGGVSMDTEADVIISSKEFNTGKCKSLTGAEDINGDGYDDLIISYYLDEKDMSGIDCVHFYYGGTAMDSDPDLILKGDVKYARLGTDLSIAGDVNNDGYNDVLISANGISDYAYIYYGGPGFDGIADITISNEDGKSFGTSCEIVGDVNNDGFDDVLIGDSGYSSYTGRAHLYFGGASMDTNADAIWNGQGNYDYFGGTVEGVGDINGDGFDDMMVGASNFYYYTEKGQSYIFYGGTNMPSSANLTLEGDAENDSFGSAHRLGDLNKDGYNDFAVSALGESSVYIYYGASGINSVYDLKIHGSFTGNEFGTSVSNAGDVNNDGYDDLIVGAKAYNNNTGRAYIYYGGEPADNVADVIMTGETADDLFGVSVSGVGDVNKDGYDDVIVSAYGYDNKKGRTYIYYGGTNMDNVADVVMTGYRVRDLFGLSVSGVGDVNNDGYDDVIVGVSNENARGYADIFLGGADMDHVGDFTISAELGGSNISTTVSGAGDVNNDGYDDIIVGDHWTEDAYIFYGGESINPLPDLNIKYSGTTDINFAYSVSGVGDVNNDGFDDVMIGCFSSNGSVYIYYGGTAMDTEADVILKEELEVSNYGIDVSGAGDVNNDGYSDVIVGASKELYTEATHKAYLYYGGANMSDSPSSILSGHVAKKDLFGFSVSGAGDVNKDNHDEVIIGAFRSPDNGAAFLYAYDPLAGIESVEVTDIKGFDAMGIGFIDNIGNQSSTAHGFCWSTSNNPTIVDNKNDLGKIKGAGQFSGQLEDLTPLTKYFIKAYVTDYTGTRYGKELTFTTPKADQSITFDALSAVTYGDNTFDLTATASSNLPITYSSSDNSVVSITGSTITIHQSGTATITAAQEGNEIYNPAPQVQQVLTVNKASLTITADDKSKIYGAVNPTLSIRYSDFVNGEDATALSTQPTVTTTADASSGVGSVPITVSGAASDNYSFNYVNGALIINKAELTVTADDKSKIYGDANPEFTFRYMGFVNGEDPIVIDTEPSAISIADASTGVGSADITLSGGIDDNYSFSYVNGTLSIGKAELTATADDKSKTYGEHNPNLTISYSGFVNGENAFALSTVPTASSSADVNTGVGSWLITASGGVADNYTFKYVNGTLSIEKAELTVTADDKSKAYGETNPALTLSYDGFVNGENASDLSTVPTASSSAGANTGVGSSVITASGGASDNYSFKYVNGNLTINKAELTVTADDKSKTYGDENPAFTVSYSGFVNGENELDLTTAPTAHSNANQFTGVGSMPITLTNGTADNYSFKYVNGILTINKAELTVRADDSSKTYGEENPFLSVSYSGFVNTDDQTDLQTAPTASTSADANTGAGSAVITVSGGASPNYLFKYVNGSLTINKVELTVTAQNKSKTYGAANPAFTISYAGFVNADDVSDLTSESTANSTADENTGAGSVPIIVSGGSADNYSFRYHNGNLTINKANLSVIADDKSKTYGDENPEFTVSYLGFVNGDDATVLTKTPTAFSTASEASGAGSAIITVSGGEDENYNFSYVNGTLDINKAVLTVSAEDQTKTYGESNPAFTIRYAGFVNGEDISALTTEPAAASTADQNTNAGVSDITVSGGIADNYSFNYVKGSLIINKVELSVTADDKSKTYGEANPLFTLSYAGFVSGEDAKDLATVPTASSLANETTGAGSVPITLTGGVADNYTFNYTDAILTINKAYLTVTAEDKIKIYGEANPTFTNSYVGFVNGDDVSVLTKTPTAFSTASEATGAGSAIITVSGGEDENYNFSYVNGSLDINKAVLTVSAEDQTKTYGESNPAFTIRYTGFVNGEDVSALTTEPAAVSTADQNTNAGVSDITVSGGIADNYSFNYVKGTLNINKAELTVTADSKSKTYGEANPELTVSYTGFVNSDHSNSLTKEPTLTTVADANTVPGSVAIKVSGAQSDNYTFTYQNGTLSIKKAELTVTAEDKVKLYGEVNPEFTFKYSGFVNGDDASALTSQPKASSSADAGTGTGEALIVVSGGESDLYNFKYQNGTLSINKAILNVSTDDITRNYGENNPEFKLKYIGFVNGDDVRVLSQEPVATCAANSTTEVSGVEIIISGGAADNYKFEYEKAMLLINPAELYVTVDNKTRAYGEVNPEFTLSYTGFVNGDEELVLDTKPTCTTEANQQTGIGDVDIIVSGGSDSNYNFNHAKGILTINRAELTVSADDKAITYGDDIPEFTLSYAGFVNGESESVLTAQPVVTSNANVDSNAGTEEIKVTGGAADNYSLKHENGTLSIIKAELTVSADDKSKKYGEANPEFSLSYKGFVKGEDVLVLNTQPDVSSTADETTNVGTEEITVTGGAAENYSFKYMNGSLSIGKAELTVTADNQSREQGAENPELTLSYSGFLNGDDESDIDVLPVATCEADENSTPGDYDITIDSGEDNNYDFNYVKAVLSVTLVTGIADLELAELVAYPNPSKEWLAIKWTGNRTYNAEIQILSMNGSVVKTIHDYNKGSKINISELRAGTYMVRIKIEDTYQIKKIIKL